MMKHKLLYVLAIGISLGLGACLKGRVPSEVKLPVSRIDSTFLNYFKQTSGVVAAEGTASIVLSDGRTLWLFGAAHLNDYVSATGMMSCSPNAHNAAMISDNSFTMQTLNTGNADFIPSNESGKWFVPLQAYQYFDTVFVFVKKEGGGLNTRTYIAKFHYPDMQYQSLDSFNFNNTLYGYSAFVDSSKGFCYVYGLYQPNSQTDNDLYVARFPMNNVHITWQYFANNDWVNLPSGATSIAKVPGENFSIRKVKSKYIFLTQEGGKACNKGREIYSQTTGNPWGPFLNPQHIYTITDNLSNVTPVTYGVTLHPQFLNANDEVLITYSINGYGSCIPTCSGGYDNPDYYRIRTLRVGLKKIDVAY